LETERCNTTSTTKHLGRYSSLVFDDQDSNNYKPLIVIYPILRCAVLTVLPVFWFTVLDIWLIVGKYLQDFSLYFPSLPLNSGSLLLQYYWFFGLISFDTRLIVVVHQTDLSPQFEENQSLP
jgi:hypothetical protein